MSSSSATRAKSTRIGRPEAVTVTVGELRSNFKAVEAKLAKGARVRVTRRGQIVAEMLAPVSGLVAEAHPGSSFQDFLQERERRLHRLWGGPQDIDTTAMILEGRNRDLLS